MLSAPILNHNTARSERMRWTRSTSVLYNRRWLVEHLTLYCRVCCISCSTLYNMAAYTELIVGINLIALEDKQDSVYWLRAWIEWGFFGDIWLFAVPLLALFLCSSPLLSPPSLRCQRSQQYTHQRDPTAPPLLSTPPTLRHQLFHRKGKPGNRSKRVIQFRKRGGRVSRSPHNANQLV